MPSLRHLLEEFKKLRVNPDDVRVSARVYDRLVEQGKDIVEDNPGEDD